ncbi:MAG: hypothetical protein R3A44_31890 [Caldilineaceae bacterium]
MQIDQIFQTLKNRRVPLGRALFLMISMLLIGVAMGLMLYPLLAQPSILHFVLLVLAILIIPFSVSFGE